MCPIHGIPVEHLEEENYFFRLSAYADRLLEHYERRPEAVQPETRRNEVLSLIRGGLQDFSISRTNFRWGIPLPWDPSHVCYVWFDALTNYITAAGYGTDEARFSPGLAGERPPDRQGHPAVPRRLLAGHAHGGRASSRPSRCGRTGSSPSAARRCRRPTRPGSIPSSSMDHFGVDSYRYFFMREIQFGQDGSFSWESMVDRHNADLANGLGNLASRILAMLASSFDGVVPEPEAEGVADDLPELTADVARRYEEHMAELALTQALAAVWEIVGRANGYLVERQPWTLVNDEMRRAELAGILYASAETLRILAILIAPIMPGAAARLWEQLGIEEPLDAQRFPEATAWGGLRPGDEDRQGRPAVPSARLLSEGSRRHVSRGTHLLDFLSRAACARRVVRLRIFEPGSRIGRRRVVCRARERVEP